MAQKKKATAPEVIGKALAHFQDTVDLAVTWGFLKLKSTKIPARKEDHKAAGVIKKTANVLFRFFGEMGENFYSEYEKIKQDRNSDSKK